jgi:hypothetical protein
VGSPPALNGFFARRLRMARHLDAVLRLDAAASALPGLRLEAAE